MRISVCLPALAALMAMSACASGRGRAAPAADWRDTVSVADRNRIRTWRDAWTAALAKAQASGNAGQIAAEGALLSPDAVLGGPAPPPGGYRCRVIKLGATAPGGRDFVASSPIACRIEAQGDTLAIAALDGPQRPAGRLYPDGPMRMIFLGAMRMADENRALDYRGDPERDMVGIVERTGPRRWRLVLPWPRWEATLEVVELVPAG